MGCDCRRLSHGELRSRYRYTVHREIPRLRAAAAAEPSSVMRVRTSSGVGLSRTLAPSRK